MNYAKWPSIVHSGWKCLVSNFKMWLWLESRSAGWMRSGQPVWSHLSQHRQDETVECTSLTVPIIILLPFRYFFFFEQVLLLNWINLSYLWVAYCNLYAYQKLLPYNSLPPLLYILSCFAFLFFCISLFKISDVKSQKFLNLNPQIYFVRVEKSPKLKNKRSSCFLLRVFYNHKKRAKVNLAQISSSRINFLKQIFSFGNKKFI